MSRSFCLLLGQRGVRSHLLGTELSGQWRMENDSCAMRLKEASSCERMKSTMDDRWQKIACTGYEAAAGAIFIGAGVIWLSWLAA